MERIFNANPSRYESGEPGMGKAVLDVRAIANFALDVADKCGVDVTNMALNKIVYFVHCDYLLEKGEFLVSAKIEAWQHGPVFREIYHEFKKWGEASIKSRALKVNPNTGVLEKASVSFSSDEADDIARIVKRYIRFSAAQLRAISHREGGPWAYVWGHDGKTNPGMRITNEIILNLYSPGVKQ